MHQIPEPELRHSALMAMRSCANLGLSFSIPNLRRCGARGRHRRLSSMVEWLMTQDLPFDVPPPRPRRPSTRTGPCAKHVEAYLAAWRRLHRAPRFIPQIITQSA
jgi:hypothetical protein